MTTTTKKVSIGDNPAVENTEGVPIDGFQESAWVRRDTYLNI